MLLHDRYNYTPHIHSTGSDLLVLRCFFHLYASDGGAQVQIGGSVDHARTFAVPPDSLTALLVHSRRNVVALRSAASAVAK